MLNEAVVLAGLYAGGNAEHQEKLHWGRAPSLLYRLCTLPPAFVYADPQRPQLAHLPDVLLPTLLAASADVQRNREVVEETIGLAALDTYAQRQPRVAPARAVASVSSATDAPRTEDAAGAGCSTEHEAAVDGACALRTSASDAATQTSGTDHCLHVRLPSARLDRALRDSAAARPGPDASTDRSPASSQPEHRGCAGDTAQRLHFRPAYRMVNEI